MGIAVMLKVQRRREGFENMTQDSMDRVFDKRPCEQSEPKHCEVRAHNQGLRRLQLYLPL
jgi:hypothetical protein